MCLTNIKEKRYKSEKTVILWKWFCIKVDGFFSKDETCLRGWNNTNGDFYKTDAENIWDESIPFFGKHRVYKHFEEHVGFCCFDNQNEAFEFNKEHVSSLTSQFYEGKLFCLPILVKKRDIAATGTPAGLKKMYTCYMVKKFIVDQKALKESIKDIKDLRAEKICQLYSAVKKQIV